MCDTVALFFFRSGVLLLLQNKTAESLKRSLTTVNGGGNCNLLFPQFFTLKNQVAQTADQAARTADPAARLVDSGATNKTLVGF